MQEANDCMCPYRLSHITYSAYRDTMYKLVVISDKLWVILQGTISDPITQFVNFTVKLGEDKGTVPASRNYTKPPASQ